MLNELYKAVVLDNDDIPVLCIYEPICYYFMKPYITYSMNQCSASLMISPNKCFLLSPR